MARTNKILLRKLSQTLENNEDITSKIIERSEEEIREEEIKNQQTIKIFIESEKKLELIKP